MDINFNPSVYKFNLIIIDTKYPMNEDIWI